MKEMMMFFDMEGACCFFEILALTSCPKKRILLSSWTSICQNLFDSRETYKSECVQSSRERERSAGV